MDAVEQPTVCDITPETAPAPHAHTLPTCGAARHTASALHAPPLSKSQQKKLAKKQKLQEIRDARKCNRKEKKAEKKARQAQQREEHLSKLGDEERVKAVAELQAEKLEQSELRRNKKQRLQQAMDGGQRIVIDLDFGDKMIEGERRSLCQQLAFCYSANTHARVPCHMYLTSADGAVGEQLQKQIAGCSQWVVSMHGESYMDVFSEETHNLVYLTPDSSEELDELDSSKVYIVGGLVDRNRHKQICFNKAQGQGISTAKLPIMRHVPLGRSQVITVDQVMRILLGYLEKRDWGPVLQSVIPARKLLDTSKPDKSQRTGGGQSKAPHKHTTPSKGAHPRGEENGGAGSRQTRGFGGVHAGDSGCSGEEDGMRDDAGGS